MTGIYIHVPFCAKKCPYCDFYSVGYRKDTVQGYVQAVVRNIDSFGGRGIKADSIYLGGGTPSLLSPSQVGDILNAAHRAFELSQCEITLEVNPSTVDKQKLEGYRKAGVNRLSIGVQSADKKELELLGRLHDFSRAERAVVDAVSAGFDNISCDIMAGTPGQSLESLERTLDRLTALPIQHISAYLLRIEQGTAFDCDKIRNSVAGEELMSRMYLYMAQKLEKAGFEQYEISNFAKKGFESRHNMKYWTGEQYIGIGPSAYSFFAGSRYHCPRDTEDFIRRDTQSVVVDEESPDRLEEYIMLGLRLARGISLGKLQELGAQVGAIAQRAQLYDKAGLCRFDGESICLTPKGWLVSNSIIAELEQLAAGQ